MEDSVSKWQYMLEGIDSSNESATETVEISVYQHKGLRSVNHEVSVIFQINETNLKNVDWQIMLIEGKDYNLFYCIFSLCFILVFSS